MKRPVEKAISWPILMLLQGCGARSVSPSDGGAADAACEEADGPTVRSYLVWTQGRHGFLDLSREGLVEERVVGENDVNRVVPSGPYVLSFTLDGRDENISVSRAPDFLPIAEFALDDLRAAGSGPLCGVVGRRAFVVGSPPEPGAVNQIIALDLDTQAVADVAPLEGFGRDLECVVCDGLLCILERSEDGLAIVEPDPLRFVDTDPSSPGAQTVSLSRTNAGIVGIRDNHVFIHTSDPPEAEMPGISVESVELAPPWTKEVLATSEALGRPIGATMVIVDVEHLWYFVTPEGLGVYDPSKRSFEDRPIDWWDVPMTFGPWGLLPGPAGTLVAWGRDGSDLLYSVVDPCTAEVLHWDRRSDWWEMDLFDGESVSD